MRLITSFPFRVSDATLVLLTELPDEFASRVGFAINEAYQNAAMREKEGK